MSITNNAKRTRLRECSHKVTYGTWAKATKAARLLKRNAGDITHPYHCKFCGGIHTGGGLK